MSHEYIPYLLFGRFFTVALLNLIFVHVSDGIIAGHAFHSPGWRINL